MQKNLNHVAVQIAAIKLNNAQIIRKCSAELLGTFALVFCGTGAIIINQQTSGEAYSAGIETPGVNPRAIETMKEDGIDISHHTSNNIDEYRNIDFDFVITVCDNAKERCPFFPTTAKKFHQNFSDPAKATGTEEEIKEQFRQVRQQIKDYCKKFIAGSL